MYVVATSADSYISKFKSQYKEFYKTPFIGDSAGHILIAAGNDIDTLIESYPLKEGYSVLPGKIYKNSDAELGTYFKLSLSDIEAIVPSEYETSLDLANPKKDSATNSCIPLYTITVKWGSSGIPWIDDVGKIDG
ncbi:hypothetical protein GUA87_03460 [Sneathiella sp. P13V-1]|uniref:hypothetical protein n=1 Tax=Sneathiella sp. P13V-1 TaxID=2697366 RepID=UPI00187B417D|nr:hypothetical protein [Sneathiella sp. P13V-1]MBE7635886.1 hypothetical protein [Sneathiella sp. P13V-1]